MLKITGLYKRFGNIVAVNDANLHIAHGETVVIMGPSGCGKSTLIRCINRLLEPDAGEVVFKGIAVRELDHRGLLKLRKRIGFVFQQFNLIERLTALENVMFGLVLDGMDRELARAKAVEALGKVGLENHLFQRPGEMSGGQQQRVGIARALAMEPEMMLWDEPTASLDPILVREVLVVMEELAKYHAMPMAVVTHEISFALHVADRIVLMDKGTIVEEGPPHQIFTAPQSEVGELYRQLVEYQLNSTGLKLNGAKVVA